jgi:hypothetical protein
MGSLCVLGDLCGKTFLTRACLNRWVVKQARGRDRYRYRYRKDAGLDLGTRNRVGQLYCCGADQTRQRSLSGNRSRFRFRFQTMIGQIGQIGQIGNHCLEATPEGARHFGRHPACARRPRASGRILTGFASFMVWNGATFTVPTLKFMKGTLKRCLNAFGY